jgi:RimJ/RimL family protein N-acetyltransferase
MTLPSELKRLSLKYQQATDFTNKAINTDMLLQNEFGQLVGAPIKNWQSKQFPPKKVMKGQYCILEPIDVAKHATRLFESLSLDNQGESWTYLPYGPFETCENFIEWLVDTMSLGDTLLYAILDPKTQLPIGICSYLRINPEHGVIEVGHLHFSTLLKRTPAATEAMYLMMYHAFEELAYRRYEWKCHSLNQASRAAALRLGFTFEGVFRQSNVFKNHNRDTAWFSIIDSEWPAIKARFERWLDINNFDHNGNQIVKLQAI